MGLFSSKTKTRTDVASSISRVIQDNMIPDAILTGTLKGIFSSGGIPENIMEEMIGSMGVRAERMYAYGKNGYIYGLPGSSMLFSNGGSTTVAGVLETIEGRPVTVNYYHYGPLNSLHYGWKTLCETYGYSAYSNELTGLSGVKGSPVYLEDLQVVVVEATTTELNNGALAQWGNGARAGYTPGRPVNKDVALRTVAHTPFAVSPTATSDYFLVTYVWVDANRNLLRDTFTFAMSTEDPNHGYFQVKYSFGALTDNGGIADLPPTPDPNNPFGPMITPPKLEDANVRYFTYAEDEGSWPELDELFKHAYPELGSFFPFCHFRHNKVSLVSNQTSAEYKSSVKLAKFLGVDFKTVSDAIDANPDIAHITSATMMMGVPVDTGNPIELRYLFDFFKGVYTKSGNAGFPQSVESADLLSKLQGTTAYALADSVSVGISDPAFSMSLSMNGIYRRRKIGTIGPIGSHSMVSAVNQITNKGVRIVPNAPEAEEGWHYEDTVVTTDYPYRAYRKQVAPFIYEEIQVYGYGTNYVVGNGYAAAGNMLLVPLDRAITQNYSIPDKEELYARSLHIVVNTLVITETKVKWYQQGWFQAVLIIVAIVLTVLDLGADGGGWLAMVEAITAMTAVEIALSIIIYLAITVVIKVALKLFVKAVGAEASAILAIVMVVAAVFGVLSSDGVAGAPWASDLIQLSNGLMSAVEASYKEALNGLYEEGKEFNIFAQDKYKTLEDTNKLLENSTKFDPLIIWGEAPNDFFNRTVHAGNIGVLSIEAISSYVDISLTLPTIDKTLAEDAFSYT